MSQQPEQNKTAKQWLKGLSKKDVKQSPFIVACGKKTFNEWADDIKRYAQRKK